MTRILSHRRAAALAFVVFLVMAWVQPTSAQEVLFEDDFSTLAGSLGEPSDALGVKDGALFDRLDKNQWSFLFYQSKVFEDADITVKVQLTDPEGEKGAGVGLLFWSQDWQNAYVLELSDSGTFAVRRFTPNRFLFPVRWKTTDAIKTGAGEWNELRVVTRGKWATISINGKELAKIKGAPPEGGSLVGLYFETGADAADVGHFTGLKIVEPAPTTEAAPPDANPDVLYADDFAALDSAWGVESGTFGVKDGKMFVVTEPGYSKIKFWEGEVFQGNLDATVKVHVGKKNDKEFPTGGLIFWASDWADFYTLQIYHDGTVGCSRYLKDSWLYPVNNKPIPAEAKYDPNGMTELRVVTDGQKANLFVNGVSVGVVSGEPPANGSYAGVYSESGKAGAQIDYDDFVIKKK